MKPTLEEIKEYFKEAQECSSTQGSKFDMIEYDLENIYVGVANAICVSKIGHPGDKKHLYDFDSCEYAKILTYKKNDMKEELEELWLPIHNYFGFYEVSNMGNVRSLSRDVKHSKNPEFTKKVFGRLLSKSINSSGYYKVNLSMYNSKKTHLVYHLVSEAFLGHLDRNEFVCVDHIDENKLNDRVDNLQIISKQENTKKSFDYKLDAFKAGDYWFHSTGSLVLIDEVTKTHGGTIKCKHIDNTDNFAFHGIACMDREATNEEVFEALKSELIRLGVKEGSCFVCLESKKPIICFDSEHGLADFAKSYNNEYIYFGGVKVYENGKFATIIETITKQEAEKLLNKKIV